MAIAFILLRCEQTARFDLADNWYEYLVNVIDRASGSEPELGWLSIVTFNYDRSLEEFLITCLAEMFGKDREAMTDIVASTDLVHMYGSLGSPWPKDKNFVKYGTFDEKNRKAAVHDAAAEIKTIWRESRQ